MIASLVVVISFSFDQGLLRPEGTTSTCARVQAATGWRRRQTAPLIRLMFPEVHTHFESPRQEEYHSTPAEMRTVTLSSDVVPPVGRQDQGLSRAPSPYLREPASQPHEAMENSRCGDRSQLRDRRVCTTAG